MRTAGHGSLPEGERQRNNGKDGAEEAAGNDPLQTRRPTAEEETEGTPHRHVGGATAMFIGTAAGAVAGTGEGSLADCVARATAGAAGAAGRSVEAPLMAPAKYSSSPIRR